MTPPLAVVVLLLVVAFVPMIFEARLAARHDRALRASGAAEPPDDVIRWMQVVYPAAFLSMAAESYAGSNGPDGLVIAGACVFALAKALKYWAIATLGPRWTFRVLVPPRSTLVTAGPYRYVRHPNYIGVMGELAGYGLMAHAAYTGAASMLMFAWLIARRIRVEERALHIDHRSDRDRSHRVS